VVGGTCGCGCRATNGSACYGNEPYTRSATGKELTVSPPVVVYGEPRRDEQTVRRSKSLTVVLERHIRGKADAEREADRLRKAIVENTVSVRLRERLGLDWTSRRQSCVESLNRNRNAPPRRARCAATAGASHVHAPSDRGPSSGPPESGLELGHYVPPDRDPRMVSSPLSGDGSLEPAHCGWAGMSTRRSARNARPH